MKLGQEVWIHGYIDEMRKDIAIIKNEGGYFGAVYDEIQPAQINMSVIEDIKAEIKAEWQADMYDDKFGVADCLKIIEKHISGK